MKTFESLKSSVADVRIYPVKGIKPYLDFETFEQKEVFKNE